MKRIFSLLVFLIGSAPGSGLAEGAPVVVELFTSQGCYSCPPADEVLGELAERDDVIALGLHVTYWDRLGWPDTLGSKASTERQYWYRGRIEARGVYTPQMVIHGQTDIVGSSRNRVISAVDRLQDENRNAAAAIEIARAGNVLQLDFDPTSSPVTAEIFVAVFDARQVVEIERGENAGKTLTYHHPVRSFRSAGNWNGAATSLELALKDLAATPEAGVAVFAQSADGRVLAAAQHRPWKD